MLGEAYPGDTEGMTAVGNTVLNRLAAGNYGSSITRIVKAPNQYAAWGIGSQAASQNNNPAGRFPEGSPQFQAALALAQKLTSGEIPDNTRGATDYRAASLGTKWAKGADTVNIGGNVFKTGSVDGTGRLAYSGGGSSAVRETQTALKNAGFDPGPIDGQRGSQTTAAIKAFQRANGLTVDGIAGPQTKTVLAATQRAPNVSGSPDDRSNPGTGIRSIQINPDGTAVNPADEPYNIRGNTQATGSPAPAPMPGRPGALSGSQAPAPQQPTMVRTSTGKWVQTGIVPSSNPGHQLQITDDGHGNAVITHLRNPGEIPGVIDPLNEPKSTIAGSIVQRTIADMKAKATPQIGATVEGVKQTASDAAASLAGKAGDIGSTLGGIGSTMGNAFSGLGNIFSSHPAPADVGYKPSNPNYLSRGTDSTGAGPSASELHSLIGSGGTLQQVHMTPSDIMHGVNVAGGVAPKPPSAAVLGGLTAAGGATSLVPKNVMAPSAPQTVTSAPQYKFDPAVQQLQQHLGIKADGMFGPQTAAAVRQFQQANGLTPDGIVGKQTLAALTARQQPAPVVRAPVATPAPAPAPVNALAAQQAHQAAEQQNDMANAVANVYGSRQGHSFGV